MVDKNMLLVNTIEKFPCLYNTNFNDYSKKDITDKAWNEISSQTQLTVAECKEKWKNLRYGLLRSLKPHPDGTIKKKYYLHDEMEFVLPYIKYSKQFGTVTTSLDDDTDEEISKNIIENTESPQPQQYFELDYNQIEPPKKRARSSNYKSTQQKSLHFENPDNPRRLFLLSLLPEINELTEGQMKIFRRKILQLLDDIADSHNIFHSNEWQRKSSEEVDSNIHLIHSLNDEIKSENL
ncbi:hypothetical protein K1T71_009267 [Dendrolimus kikuchii]|uniref:Uncharacterized protein n=1 Tax=Dendrolimus kikuchii TaxID=765133 RepID=A0ACC1CTZ0_9NEOP|nr:hypothetical protein K1T71_009267 [Dendrolimus kikuchii]